MRASEWTTSRAQLGRFQGGGGWKRAAVFQEFFLEHVEFKLHITGRAEEERWRRVSGAMDEMRARMRDRRLQRRARETQEIPPLPPPVQRGGSASAPNDSWAHHQNQGSAFSSHTDDGGACEAERPRTRSGGVHEDASRRTFPSGFGPGGASNLTHNARDRPHGDDRGDAEIGTSDALETFDDARAEALRGLQADRLVLQNEIKRVQHLDRAREEALRVERQRRVELEKELLTAQRGGGQDNGGVPQLFETEVRAAMRSTLASVDTARRDRDEALLDVQTELSVLQMERMKLAKMVESLKAERGKNSSNVRQKPKGNASSSADSEKTSEAALKIEALTDELNSSKLELRQTQSAHKVECELRTELEDAAKRLAEECSAFDAIEKRAQGEITNVKSELRDANRRVLNAETSAQTERERADDLEHEVRVVREQLRRVNEKNARGDASRAAQRATSPQTSPQAGTSDDCALEQEVTRLKADLQREVSLAKSALMDTDAAEVAAEHAKRAEAQARRELETVRMEMSVTQGDIVAKAAEARDVALNEVNRLQSHVATLQAQIDTLTQQLSEAHADIDALSAQKGLLTQEIIDAKRLVSNARDEAEQARRELFEERETHRRRIREEQTLREEVEAKHRLEKTEWEDSLRRARRAGSAGVSGAGEKSAPGVGAETLTRATERAPLKEVSTASVSGSAEASQASHVTPLDTHDTYAVPSAYAEVKMETKYALEGNTYRRAPRPTYAPNGLPLPSEHEPLSFSRGVSAISQRNNPQIPPESQYDRYLNSLPPSPIQGPSPPPPPGRNSRPGSQSGRFGDDDFGDFAGGDNNDRAARHSWRSRPTRPQ